MSTSEVVAQSRQTGREAFRYAVQLIRRQLGRARREFGYGLAGTVVYAVMTIASSYVIGWVTDSVLIPAVEEGEVAVAALAGAGGAVLGVAVLKAAGVSGRRAGAYAAQYRLQARDRVEVTDRFLELPISWHRRHPTGELLSNVNADAEAASAVAAPLPMAFGVVVMLVVTGVLLVVTDPFLAIIGFTVLPAIAIANLGYQRRMRVIMAESQQLRAEVSEIAHESFDAALVVKTLGREDAEVDRFEVSSDSLRDNMVAVGKLRAVFDPVMEALPNIGILAVLYIGTQRVGEGALSAGSLVTFAYLFRLVAMPMRVFAWLLSDMPRSIVGWQRIERVLEADEDIRYGSARLDSAGGASAGLDSVSYHYPDDDSFERRGIDSVSLHVPSGATVALVGPTGSGKSTIAHLLVRLFDPDAGRVILDGIDVTSIDRGVLARTASLVFQEAFLFDDTVRANITLDEPFERAEVEEAARLARAHDFISALPEGYETVIGERGASLSGGQRQRIALARALVRRPRLLVLDDATSAVDPAVESRIIDGLATLDTTVVIVAYRRSSILLADRVVFVDDGRVVGTGRHEELYASLPEYAALIDAYESSSE